MADAVRFAGGWLFDQAMEGWDVTVLTPDHAGTEMFRMGEIRRPSLVPAG
jgi:hypothetical protein